VRVHSVIGCRDLCMLIKEVREASRGSGHKGSIKYLTVF
jgi:hypothetical protein